VREAKQHWDYKAMQKLDSHYLLYVVQLHTWLATMETEKRFIHDSFLLQREYTELSLNVLCLQSAEVNWHKQQNTFMVA